MDIVMPKVDKEGYLVSSVSPGKRKGGIHPVTKLTIRNCICNSPLCRQLMWILASIDARQYFPYMRLPNKPKRGEKSTATKDHVNACRKNHFHHLHGYGEEGSARKRALDGKNDIFVALIHYPEKIRECIQATPDGLAKKFKFRVPLDIGRECGLTDLDLCPTTDENGERTYFTSPIQRNVSEGSDIWNEVAVLVRKHNKKCKIFGAAYDEKIARLEEGNKRLLEDVKQRDRKIAQLEEDIKRLRRS